MNLKRSLPRAMCLTWPLVSLLVRPSARSPPRWSRILSTLFSGYFSVGLISVELKIVLKEAVGTTPEVAIRYGNFLNTLIQFLIIAWVVFMIVKAVNRMRISRPVVIQE